MILHIDINSYFATLLQQENPNLRRKPLGILKGPGRSCVIAASKEAKKLGIHAGTSLKDAREICPEILAIPAEFSRYLDATKRLNAIFSHISPDYYIYSLDEAFIDITECEKYLYPDSYLLSRQIQQRIKDDLGEWVTCNVGISHNRLLAKLASNVGKKGGILEINHENKDAYLATTTFEEVCGIGYRLSKKLALLGVTVPYQIRFYTEEELLPLFGPFWSKELLRIAYGEDSLNLTVIDRDLPHMKSVGRSITGYRLYDDEKEIERILLNLTEEVCYKVRRMNLSGRHVSVYLRGQEHSWYDHTTLKHYVRHTSEMFDVLYHQLYASWKRSFKVIKFEVRLSLLRPTHVVPQSIFPEDHKREVISQSLDAISEKYGLFTVRSGSLLNQEIIRPEVTGFLGDRKYYGL